MAGRPTKLTPETKQKLLNAIKAGAHYETACSYACVDYTTFRYWMQIGEGTHPSRPQSKIYIDFFEEVKEAEAAGEMQAIASIKGASKEDWRAAAWMLERRHAAKWANTQKIKVEVEKQVETQLNMYFESIVDDPEIPHDIKRRLIEKASDIENRATMAPQN